MQHLTTFFIITAHFYYLCNSMEVMEMAANLEQVHAFVSKVDPKIDIGWQCDCYNSTETSYLEPERECRCHGEKFKVIPTDLDENLHRLTIIDSEIRRIERDSFQPYGFTLHEVILGNLPYLSVIESGTFRDLECLRTVYISHAPQIISLQGLLEGVTSKKFLSLRIVQTSLLEIPDLSLLPTDNIMHMIDLEGNKIEKITANSINIKVDQVTLNYNAINFIEDFAFNGSQIGKLSLRGNKHLSNLGTNAFNGMQSLSQLDLSETSIEQLPMLGLGEIEVLKIEKTPTMKIIPSVYEFPSLKEAYLTHPFHCCAFKYPEQHDPKRHAQYEEKIRKGCKENTAAFDTGQAILAPADKPSAAVRKKRNPEQDEDSWGNVLEVSNYNVMGYESGRPSMPTDWSPNLAHHKGHPNKSRDHSHLNPLTGKTIEREEPRPINRYENQGTFHESFATHPENIPITAFCGNLTRRGSLIKCFPEPNALNPCEDIMGSYYLRISVWFVLILAVLGNLAVVIVVLFSGGELTVPRFLMCNLAFADLCMGLYLLLIASMDLHSVGNYFNCAFDWQYGLGCQVAGFLTVFASQLSIFTLTIVTVERWFAIAYAIYLTRRIRLGLAAKVMVLGWIYSIVMAALPLFSVSNYSSTSICLPMEVNRTADKAYLISIIVINGLAFILIVFCYAQIYFSLAYETRHTAMRGEMTIAKKMALLVFTDFVCWAPIAFFALTALAGYPLIGVTRSKILLVFFYPLNSCANPYLYAIMTAQYRKDFFILLSRLGICTNKAKQYMINSSLPTNNTHPIPLLARTANGRKSSGAQTTALDDAFV